jgi:hypothetical protein
VGIRKALHDSHDVTIAGGNHLDTRREKRSMASGHQEVVLL